MSLSHVDEIALIERAKQDPDEFVKLYDMYTEAVFRYCYVRTNRDKHRSEDIAQETFLRAFKSIAKFRDQGRPYVAYLYTIARHILIEKQQETVSLEDFQMNDETAHAVSGGNLRRQDKAENKAELSILWNRVNDLEYPYSEVLILKYQEDLPNRQIADIIGKTEANVKVIAHRALLKLQQFYVSQ